MAALAPSWGFYRFCLNLAGKAILWRVCARIMSRDRLGGVLPVCYRLRQSAKEQFDVRIYNNEQ